MFMFLIILYSLFLIGQSSALIKLPSESETFIQAQEHEIINDVIQSISDINQNIAFVDVRGGFNAETDEEKQSEYDFKTNVNENQDIRSILNEIEAEEINNTNLTEDVEQVIHGFLSDLEYYKYEHNQSKDNEIGDHIVIANTTDIIDNEQLISNFDNNKMENLTEDDDEDNLGGDNEPHEQNDDINEYDPSPAQSPVSGRRIYKGHHTRISQFPFLASVHVMGQFYCAGSIIGSSLVITAASCLQLAWNNRFFRENPKFLYVRVGSTFYNGGGELIQVLEVYFHPGYEPRTLKNNLAIVRLMRQIKMSRRNKKRVKKIRYDTHANNLPINTDDLVILGWGAREVGNRITNPMNNRLSYASLDTYGLEDCQDVYSKEFVTNKNFCAGFISKGGGACNRDVGAPGLVGGILAGVVSFGAPVCGALDAPTVFTKLGYYKDWIKEIIDQPFHSYSITTITFKPYMPKELIATPTTRMISRLPYIDPKVRNALKGISFLPPTTTPNYNFDSEAKNMLLMSMGRPAIQDQPYYQVKHDLSGSTVDPMVKLFGFDPIKGENPDKALRNMENQFEDNNENFIINNQPDAIGKIRDNGNSLELDMKHLRDKIRKPKKERTESKYKLMERYLLEKKELQKERDVQIDRNNQQFIEENKSKLPKQTNGDPGAINDGVQTKPLINLANPEKVPVVAPPKRPPEPQPSDFDNERLKGTLLPLGYPSEGIKKPRIPIYYEPKEEEEEAVKKQKRPSGLEPEIVKIQIHPTEIESNKKPLFPLDDETERIKKLPSDFDTESVYTKQPSSYEQTPITKKHIVSDFDPDHDAFEMLDKVVNEIKPNRDNEEPQYNDEGNGLILEQSYLPKEYIPESVPDSPNEDVQYVNIESVPMVPEPTDQNIKSPDDESIIQETFVDWENVNDDTTKPKPVYNTPLKALQNNEIPLDIQSLEKPTSMQNFREDAEGLSIKETKIGSHPRYPLPDRERDSEPAPYRAPYHLKSSDHRSDYQYETNEAPYRSLRAKTELHNIVDRANIRDNKYNNINYINKKDKLDNKSNNVDYINKKDKLDSKYNKIDYINKKDKLDSKYNKIDYINKKDKLDTIPLSMSDFSIQDERYFSEESAASSNSFSEESGLEIDLPLQGNGENANKNVLINLNIKTKINNTQNLKDEFYHIFADVVSEIAVHSNATKQWNTN